MARAQLHRAFKIIFSPQKIKEKLNLTLCAVASAYSAIFTSDRLGLAPAFKKSWNYFTSIKKKTPKPDVIKSARGHLIPKLSGRHLSEGHVREMKGARTDQQISSPTAEAWCWHRPLRTSAWNTSGTHRRLRKLTALPQAGC